MNVADCRISHEYIPRWSLTSPILPSSHLHDFVNTASKKGAANVVSKLYCDLISAAIIVTPGRVRRQCTFHPNPGYPSL